MSNDIELKVVPRNPASSMSSSAQMEAVPNEEEQEPLLDIEKQEERKPVLDTKKQEEWHVMQLKPKHTIFLSHSGAQKNFVEQLCVDLEAAKQAPFFDKRPESLPKGERFAQLIFQAARQCRLAIVVVSEEYFTRSKWPMLELAAFVEAGRSTSTEHTEARRCTILPLFLGLSCKEYGDVTRRQRWFERWDEWAQKDPRIDVDAWKEALRELDGRNGMEYVAAFGEVEYRKEVVSTSCVILKKSVEMEEEAKRVLPPWVLSILKVASGVLCSICLYIVVIYLFFEFSPRLIDPFFRKGVGDLISESMIAKNQFFESMIPKPKCSINGQPIPCPDQSLDFFNFTGPH